MTEQKINFQLGGIEMMDVFIKHPERQLPAECKFNLDVSIQHKINGAKKTVIVTPKVTIKIDEDDFVCGTIKVNFFYIVDNLEKFKKNNMEEFVLPDSFVTSLNSISLSTVRGIIYTHFKGTFLHNTILPIVNPNSFKKD